MTQKSLCLNEESCLLCRSTWHKYHFKPTTSCECCWEQVGAAGGGREARSEILKSEMCLEKSVWTSVLELFGVFHGSGSHHGWKGRS